MTGKTILTIGMLALALPASAVQEGSSGQAAGGSGQPSMAQPGQPSRMPPPTGFENQGSKQVIDRLGARTTEYEQAWNKGDVAQMASFYMNNSTYMSASGQTATGKTEIQSLIKQEHSGPMKGSQTTLTLQAVRSLTPDIAILDLEQSLTGLKQPQSGQSLPTDLHVTVVAMRQAGTWQIAALRAFPSPAAQLNVGGAGQQPSTEPFPERDTGADTEPFPGSGSDMPAEPMPRPYEP